MTLPCPTPPHPSHERSYFGSSKIGLIGIVFIFCHAHLEKSYWPSCLTPPRRGQSGEKIGTCQNLNRRSSSWPDCWGYTDSGRSGTRIWSIWWRLCLDHSELWEETQGKQQARWSIPPRKTQTRWVQTGRFLVQWAHSLVFWNFAGTRWNSPVDYTSLP